MSSTTCQIAYGVAGYETVLDPGPMTRCEGLGGTVAGITGARAQNASRIGFA